MAVGVRTVGRPQTHLTSDSSHVRLISRLQFTPGVYEIVLPAQLPLNALEMDLCGHAHCSTELLASRPKDSNSDQTRFSARSLCAEGYEDHDRSKTACDGLIEGLETDP